MVALAPKSQDFSGELLHRRNRGLLSSWSKEPIRAGNLDLFR